MKGKQKSTQLTRFADHGTSELQAKGEIKLTNTNDGYKQARVTNQFVIDRMYNYKHITKQQYIAARKLQSDYLKAYLALNLKARGIIELYEANFHYKNQLYCNLEAKHSYDNAMNSLLAIDQNSNKYQKLVEWVIIENGYLKDLQEGNSYLGIKELRIALDMLVRHYNL